MHLFDSVGLNEVLVCRNGCTSGCQAKCAVYDSGHSAKSAGGRSQLNTHAP